MAHIIYPFLGFDMKMFTLCSATKSKKPEMDVYIEVFI